MDLQKMTVAELAEESLDNRLVKNSIWTKAYQLEAEIKQLREDIQFLQNDYGDCPDAELTPRARELKRRCLELRERGE